jgi:hypothetical protein
MLNLKAMKLAFRLEVCASAIAVIGLAPVYVDEAPGIAPAASSIEDGHFHS